MFCDYYAHYCNIINSQMMTFLNGKYSAIQILTCHYATERPATITNKTLFAVKYLNFCDKLRPETWLTRKPVILCHMYRVSCCITLFIQIKLSRTGLSTTTILGCMYHASCCITFIQIKLSSTGPSTTTILHRTYRASCCITLFIQIILSHTGLSTTTILHRTYRASCCITFLFKSNYHALDCVQPLICQSSLWSVSATYCHHQGVQPCNNTPWWWQHVAKMHQSDDCYINRCAQPSAWQSVLNT
jgi:hypothetical protein